MSATEHFIPGKDASLEASIATLQSKLLALGFHIEERSWLNPVEGVWSVHIRDRDCPILFTNGKGGTELAARASALGEYFERLSAFRQVGKDRNQTVDVTIGLLSAPLLASVNPDVFKVALGGGGKAVFSHSRRAFSA